MVELKGSLGSIGLPAIVQLIGELHHSGNLELTRGASRGVLGFDDGRLVAACYGDLSGLKALAACVLELADGDFQFVEGEPADERTMDLRGSELQKHLSGLMNGELRPETPELVSANAGETEALGICPLLGFVDDATRHYSRATALHRCFATGAPSLVTSQEQRDLCLSGRFRTCARFRNASNSNSAAPHAPAVLLPPIAVGPPPAASAPSEIPPGVATLVPAPTQMRRTDAASADAAETGIGQEHEEPSISQRAVRAARSRLRGRPGLLLMAIGAGLGLILLVGALVIAMPALNRGFGQKPADIVAQPVQAVSTLTSAPITIARATALPTSVPASTPPPQPAILPTSTRPPEASTPTARAVPTISVAGATVAGPSQPLIDVRFASGPKPGWVDNPPYATWSDGAYRFQARQATRFVAVRAPIDRPLGDVVVSATFRKTGGPPGGGYGVVIRAQSNAPLDGVNQDARAYVMETGDLGEFGVWRRDGDHWVDLVPWTRSDSIRPGGSPNDLMVRAIGNRLTFMVNATEVATIQDDTLGAGGVGVFVGGDYNEVALDRFAVQLPD